MAAARRLAVVMQKQKKICFRITRDRICAGILTATILINLIITGAMFEITFPPPTPTQGVTVSFSPTATETKRPTPTSTLTATSTATHTPTATDTATLTPTNTNTPVPTATRRPSATPCPRLNIARFVAVPVGGYASTAFVDVSWSASGGCGPIRGTLSAQYADQPFLYSYYPVFRLSGTVRDVPPQQRRCGSFPILYTLTLQDGKGQRAMTRSETFFYWYCPPPASPTPAPLLSPYPRVG